MSNQQQPAAEIKIADNFLGAEYSNIAQINHNKEEFQLTFANISGQTGRVVAKIISSPGHFKRLISAMAENLKKYENQFGKIEEAKSPLDKEIGFKS